MIVIGAAPGSAGSVISDAVFGAGWNADTTNGASKNALYDKIITLQAIIPREQTVASAATVTPDADANDIVTVTAQAAALLIANPTGTPVQGQPMIIRVKDNGTARAITYGAKFRAIGVTLSTTTVISKTLYIGVIYNATDDKWDVLGVNQEA